MIHVTCVNVPFFYSILLAFDPIEGDFISFTKQCVFASNAIKNNKLSNERGQIKSATFCTIMTVINVRPALTMHQPVPVREPCK